MRISLFKWTAGPWEKARGFVHKDLEHLEVALNRFIADTESTTDDLSSSLTAGARISVILAAVSLRA